MLALYSGVADYMACSQLVLSWWRCRLRMLQACAIALVSMALLISQLAGALMVVLPMVHAHAAGWCS